MLARQTRQARWGFLWRMYKEVDRRWASWGECFRDSYVMVGLKEGSERG